MKLARSLLIPLLALLSGVTVCQAASQNSHLNRANASEPESLDPQLVHTLPGMRVINDLFDGLIHRDPAGKIVSGQASSWTTSANGLIWTFTLRESQWSDGKPVTAGDFVRAWRRAVDPATASPYAWYLEIMAITNASAIVNGLIKSENLGVSAPDNQTFRVQLEHPRPSLPQMLVMPVLYPIPPGALEIYGREWTTPKNLVTNGPYRLKDWIINEKITLQANSRHPDYNSLAINTVSYLTVPSSNSAYNRYRSGELDMTLNIPDNFYQKLKTTKASELHTTHMLGTEYLAFNTRRSPFNDSRVRQALSLAVDRELITSNILGEGQIPAYNFTPEYMQGMPSLSVKS